MKGPTAKLMAELGLDVTNDAIADYYSGLIDGLVIDASDAGDRELLQSRHDIEVMVTGTLMQTDDDRERLARETLDFANSLTGRSR